VIGLVLATTAAVAFGTGTFIQHMTAQAVEAPTGRHRTQHGRPNVASRRRTPSVRGRARALWFRR
jgi:hypothetical protein